MIVQSSETETRELNCTRAMAIEESCPRHELLSIVGEEGVGEAVELPAIMFIGHAPRGIDEQDNALVDHRRRLGGCRSLRQGRAGEKAEGNAQGQTDTRQQPRRGAG